ncbi:MAG: hypothetical protein LBD28_05770 [Tannerellaceae bacterium]|jgi:hypothetical protein|nr:hypothetical protein [Tannerellaceae bacterium]
METFFDPKIPTIFLSLFKSDESFGLHLADAILPQLSPFANLQCMKSEINVDDCSIIEAQSSPIVEFACIDRCGQKRVIAIWLAWSETFRSKIVLKAKRAAAAAELPVHTICFANLIIDDTSESYCQRYDFSDGSDMLRGSEAQDLIVVELPKFKVADMQAPTVAERWLSFLSDINGDICEAPSYLLDDPETAAAIDLIKRRAESEARSGSCLRFLSSVDRHLTQIANLDVDMGLLRRLYMI